MNRIAILVVCGVLSWSLSLQAQRGRAGGGPPPAAQTIAGADLTGYWVALVTEDWRWRMMTPPKGDFPSIPLSPEGRRVANEWDPAKETAGDRCKAYGAGNILWVPTRMHITWEDPNTLKVEFDAGTQTRLLKFGGGTAAAATAVAAQTSLQGTSTAIWEYAGGRGPRAGGPVPKGQMKVVTTGLAPGYLQRNGVPYSDRAVVTEHFNRLDQPTGDALMAVTVRVEDPLYLNGPFVRSANFKKEPDGSKWNPQPCE